MKDHSIKPKYFENERVAPLRSGAAATATSKNSS